MEVGELGEGQQGSLVEWTSNTFGALYSFWAILIPSIYCQGNRHSGPCLICRTQPRDDGNHGLLPILAILPMPLPLSLERITGRETLLVRAPSCVSLSLADQDHHPGEFISLLRFLAKLCRVETAMRSEKTDPQPNSLSPARGYPQAKVRAPRKEAIEFQRFRLLPSLKRK